MNSDIITYILDNERCLGYHQQDRKEMFQFFDEDSNGTLDMRELGKLNAAIFNIFPRFGYKGTDPPGMIYLYFFILIFQGTCIQTDRFWNAAPKEQSCFL